MANVFLSKAVEGFLLSKTVEGYSQETLKLCRWALSAMVEYLKDPDIKAVTSKELQGFYAYFQTSYIPHRTNGDKSPLKPRSIENAWTAIRSFFN